MPPIILTQVCAFYRRKRLISTFYRDYLITLIKNRYSWSFIKRHTQTSGTSSDNEWQRMKTSGTTNDNEWQRVVQRVTTSDNEWQRMKTSENEWQRVTTNDTTSDNKWKRVRAYDSEWQRMIQRVITNENEWQWLVQRIKMNESKWEQVKRCDFGFRMKQNMQCKTTLYSAIFEIC